MGAIYGSQTYTPIIDSLKVLLKWSLAKNWLMSSLNLLFSQYGQRFMPVCIQQLFANLIQYQLVIQQLQQTVVVWETGFLIKQYFIIINLSHIMLGQQKSNFYTVKDLPAADFITAFSQYLKKNNLVERPKWADYAKTSTANELAPLDDDWIYTRVAALARKIYVRPRTGVNLLSHIYGKKYRVASRHPRHEHGSSKIIRWSLQQLEKQKIIKKDKKGDALKINSRVISEQGRGTLNRIATEFINSKNKK